VQHSTIQVSLISAKVASHTKQLAVLATHTQLHLPAPLGLSNAPKSQDWWGLLQTADPSPQRF
jgi:hypothetical protein